MLNNLKEKLRKFMIGRYGADQLSRFMLGIVLIFIVLSIFIRSQILNGIVILLIVICYFRMFSKNHQKRYAENQKFLNIRYKLLGRFGQFQGEMKQRKTNHIYRCPNCKQKIRVPKGKGKICITCPKCKTEFTKKS